MPIVKSIPIRTTVERSLAYILNPDKTEDLLYTSSLNCMTNAKDTYLNMKLVYEQFSGKKFDEPIPEKAKARVKAIHYIQSFSPDENITPQKAHDIAKAFALKAFGNEAQFVISTHCDKNHLHSHIIINTYSLTGKKFNDNKTSRQNIRNISDGVCLAFGIQPIKQGQGTSRIASYTEWDNKRKGMSWKEKIRQEIDKLIPDVKNLDELLYELEIRGYEVKKGKYISVKAPDQKRFVRTKTLGEGYTAYALASRILWSKVGIDVNAVDIKPSELRDKYQFVLEQVIQLSRDNKKVQRKNNNAESYNSQNDRDVYILSAQLSIINRDRMSIDIEVSDKMFFRVLAAPSSADTDQAQWFSLPDDIRQLREFAAEWNAAPEHMYYKEVESALPNISDNAYNEADWVEQMISLSEQLADMPRDQIVKLKAVMEAENIQTFTSAREAVESLNKYDFDAIVQDESQFGKWTIVNKVDKKREKRS